MNAKYLIIFCLIIINYRTAKTADNPEVKEIQKLPSCSTNTQDWSHLAKLIEINKLWQKLLKLHRGDLTGNMLKHKIMKWLETKIGKGEGEIVELTETDFTRFIESLDLNLEVLQELNKPECTTSTQDLSHLEKAIEIKELCEKSLKLKELNLEEDFPVYKDKIIEWIGKNTANDEGLIRVEVDEDDEKFQLTGTNFKDLLESLNLSLEELRDLNELLGKKPRQ